ncbi:hydroxyacylglutathione hydrolase [Lentibacillus kapialis]|uniref:Hydroxyacylglutathione hydrolase n=1 Tax=Lentibacillus kapialis TaxID=340214 RepID=A0A917Q0C7_9BACI|nr:MBL fold metallo-hydrolase [Lentibacillus kapialis]GGK03284.1 hydroxyacylglutathione hydrolase [Lentibacillus kapialis]
MKIASMEAGPLGTNCYMVHNETDALIFDPGGDSEEIIGYLTENKVEPKAILLTHAHFDHIGGVDALRSYYNINVYLHDKEAEWLENPEYNGSTSFMGSRIVTKPAEHNLEKGRMAIGDITFEVIHTPGHSPGSVSFIFHDQQFVISGDVLFNRGIGRTDLPGGNMNVLEQSIRETLYQLPDSYTVYPGHGPATAIGNEKKHNPFFSI